MRPQADLLPNDNYSIAALLDPQLSSSAADVSGDNIKSLLAKCCVLMEYAGKLDIERIASAQLSEDWWTRFDNCDNAVSQYVHTMPPVQLARNIEELAYLLHATLAESEIAVSTQGASEDILSDGSLSGLSYTRCIESCRATALAATIIEDIDMSYMLLFTGVAWVCVAVVLTKEVSRLRRAGRIQQASEKEKQLAVIERCMERLATTYPVLSLQVKQLRDLKDW
ncbi:hypothetical protein FRC09_003957 [Ceratobasidium sp. 395]|nr:hypothetical protein FRC09_003957 [Ceratobasidium sp. 395]